MNTYTITLIVVGIIFLIAEIAGGVLFYKTFDMKNFATGIKVLFTIMGTLFGVCYLVVYGINALKG